MEQQEVTTAKAGVCASLPARTSVVAAANPSGGHYTRAKTVAENIRLSSAMLSRFDVTFLLLDRPDEALDEKLSEHILALHSGQYQISANILPIISLHMCPYRHSLTRDTAWDLDLCQISGLKHSVYFRSC